MTKLQQIAVDLAQTRVDVSFDAVPEANVAEDGVYVQAWVFVPNADILASLNIIKAG